MQSKNEQSIKLSEAVEAAKGELTYDQLALKLGVKKTSLFRAAKQDWRRDNGAMSEIAKKLNVDMSTDISPEKCKPVLDVIKEIWDGSEKHALVIANLLKGIDRLAKQAP